MHSDFENVSWNEENEKRADDTEFESVTAGYSAMVSGKCEMTSWMCGGSHRSIHAVRQSRVKEPTRFRVVRPVKVLLFFAPVVNGEFFHDGPAWTDESTAFMFAAGTFRCHVHLVRRRHRLPNSIHYLPNIKRKFLEPRPADHDDLQAVVDAVCSESPAVEKASTQASRAPRRLEEIKLGSSAALPPQAECFTRSKPVAHSFRKIKTYKRVFATSPDR